MTRIVTIEKLGDVFVTVIHSCGNNYLQFKVPQGFTGEDFDEWWHEHRDELSVLKYLIWVDKVESLTE